jgi:hypothetical protein
MCAVGKHACHHQTSHGQRPFVSTVRLVNRVWQLHPMRIVELKQCMCKAVPVVQRCCQRTGPGTRFVSHGRVIAQESPCCARLLSQTEMNHQRARVVSEQNSDVGREGGLSCMGEWDTYPAPIAVPFFLPFCLQSSTNIASSICPGSRAAVVLRR